jgi:hypothetical protein
MAPRIMARIRLRRVSRVSMVCMGCFMMFWI